MNGNILYSAWYSYELEILYFSCFYLILFYYYFLCTQKWNLLNEQLKKQNRYFWDDGLQSFPSDVLSAAGGKHCFVWKLKCFLCSVLLLPALHILLHHSTVDWKASVCPALSLSCPSPWLPLSSRITSVYVCCCIKTTEDQINHSVSIISP